MPPPTGPKKTSPLSSTADPYALIEAAIIRDPNGKIKAVKHYPSFANAVVLLVEHAKTLGSALQIVRYVAGAEIVCASPLLGILPNPLSGDFYNALLSIQEVIDRNLAKNSMGAKQFLVFADAIVTIIKDRRVAQAVKDRAEAKKRDEVRFVRDRGRDRDGDSDVEMLSVSAICPSKRKAADVSHILLGEDMAAILDRLDILAIDVDVLQSGAEDGPDAKFLKPSVPSYRPGTAFVFTLIKNVDTLLETGGKASKEMLKEYSDVLEQTACQQLFNLDIAQQACKQLIDRRESVRTLLDNQAVEKTGILIRDLQVSKECLDGLKLSTSQAFETAMAGPSNTKGDTVDMAIEETI
ncbi:hypothetical protein DXG01_007826 [Tephrocybe rancida]|nr:hypothetical protein DXG01_007826 [Tephrocybe rancida]